MLYNFSNKIDIQRAKKRFKSLLDKGSIVELKESKVRSNNQNSYLHLILTWFGMETGYTLEESKQLYKYVNEEIYKYKHKESEHIFYRSSADLDSAELTKSIDIFREYSAQEAGIYLPLPNEDRFLQEIQVQASQTNYR